MRHYTDLHLLDEPPPGLLSGGRGLVTTGESDTMRHDGRREAERSRKSTFFLKTFNDK